MELRENIINISDLNQESFKLRSPRGNKIYKESIFSAYNKENLGTIPRDSENILIKGRRDQKRGFMSQSQRFPIMIADLNLNPGPGAYDKKGSPNTKNVKFTKAERFDDRKDFYDKYYPGPSDYKTNTSMNDSKSTRFSSLYNSKPSLSLKKPFSLPGPGEYRQYCPVSEKYSYGNVFLSKTKKSFFDAVNSQFYEPGKYYKESELIKQKNKNSHFFLSELPKKTNLVEEHLNINKEHIMPGPGSYNLAIDWSKPPLMRSTEVKPLLFENEPDYTVYHENSKHEKKTKRKVEEPKIPVYDRNVARCAFQSETKRFDDSKTHIPGPSYYHPEEIKFNNFNNNSEKKWI